MSVFYDISTALDTNLKNMVGVPSISWENRNYKPVIGTLYVRPTLIAGEVIQSTLGDNGTDRSTGIYQVDIFAESGKGKKAILEMADLIADQFKRGTDLVSNGRTVRVRNASRQVGSSNDEGWYMMIVEISYISFTEARI